MLMVCMGASIKLSPVSLVRFRVASSLSISMNFKLIASACPSEQAALRPRLLGHGGVGHFGWAGRGKSRYRSLSGTGPARTVRTERAPCGQQIHQHERRLTRGTNIE